MLTKWCRRDLKAYHPSLSLNCLPDKRLRLRMTASWYDHCCCSACSSSTATCTGSPCVSIAHNRCSRHRSRDLRENPPWPGSRHTRAGVELWLSPSTRGSSCWWHDCSPSPVMARYESADCRTTCRRELCCHCWYLLRGRGPRAWSSWRVADPGERDTLRWS